jgi:hypothetical protein
MLWTVHPAAHRPGRAVIVVLVILLATLLTWSMSGWIWMTALAPVFLLASLRAFFLPRTYRLDDEGAHEEGPLQAARHLAWSDVRRVSRGRNGVYLSPLHSDSRLVRDRGVFLRTEENMEGVADFVLSRRAPE